VAGTLAEKLIESHLVGGVAVPAEEIALRVDHTLSQEPDGGDQSVQLSEAVLAHAHRSPSGYPAGPLSNAAASSASI
jgi:hypothetical protein